MTKFNMAAKIPGPLKSTFINHKMVRTKSDFAHSNTCLSLGRMNTQEKKNSTVNSLQFCKYSHCVNLPAPLSLVAVCRDVYLSHFSLSYVHFGTTCNSHNCYLGKFYEIFLFQIRSRKYCILFGFSSRGA